MCDAIIKQNKRIDENLLFKWEIKYSKALDLIKYFVNDQIYAQIENAYEAWFYLKTFKYLLDTQ